MNYYYKELYEVEKDLKYGEAWIDWSNHVKDWNAFHKLVGDNPENAWIKLDLVIGEYVYPETIGMGIMFKT